MTRGKWVALVLILIGLGFVVGVPLERLWQLVTLRRVSYVEDGLVIKETVHRWGEWEGEPHGEHLARDVESGLIRRRGVYEDGDQVGVWNYWSEDGRITEQERCDSDSILTTHSPPWLDATENQIVADGTYVDYHLHPAEMMPWRESRYRDGIPDGVWTWWNPVGEIVLQRSYGGGELLKEKEAPPWWPCERSPTPPADGPVTAYHPNGLKRYSGAFKDGEPTGVWSYWRDDGKLWQQLEFRGVRGDRTTRGVPMTMMLGSPPWRGGARDQSPSNVRRAASPEGRGQ